MRQVGDMKLYNFEELLEEDYGPVGTPERDEFERDVDEAVLESRVSRLEQEQGKRTVENT